MSILDQNNETSIRPLFLTQLPGPAMTLTPLASLAPGT